MQTAYLKVMDGRARFAEGTDFRAFLFGVIRNTALDERRKRTIRAMLPVAMLGVQAIDATQSRDALAELARDEDSRRLLAAVDALSPRQREMILLVFYRDMTIAAAAQVLGISLGTARIHYERGKQQLRKLLGDA